MTGGAPKRTPILIGLVALGLLSAFLRLWPIEHGAPRTEYVPDTHIVRNALQMAHTKNPVPPAGTYSSYPYLLPYVMLPVYGVDYAVGRMQGEWSGAGEYGMRLKEHPWHAHRLARIVLALIAATAPLFVFGAARAAGMRLGAWVAGWLAATSLLHVQLSTMERPWAPMAAAIAATAFASARHARSGSTRSLMWAGVAAAIAAAMHQGGLPVLGIVGVAWAVAPERGRDGAPPGRALAPANLGRRVVLGVLCVALFAVVALALGYPHFLVHGATDASNIAAGNLVRDDQTQLTFAGQQMVLGFRAETFTGYLRSFVGYDPVLLLLGLGGLVSALRRRMLVPSLVFLFAWAALFMTNINEHIRYLLPMAMLLTLPAGLAAEKLIEHRAAGVVLAALLALPIVQALRLGVVLREPDTRQVAEAMLRKLDEGSRVAIDVYGPYPPLDREGLAITESLRPLHGRETHRREMLDAQLPVPPGVRAVRIEDAFEYQLRTGETWLRDVEPDLGETARSALEALGATHILLVDRTPDDGTPPPLLDPTPPEEPSDPDGVARKLAPLKLDAAPLWTVHPAWERPTVPDDRTAEDAHLPTALSFPLRDLWSVRRPGPKLQLWRL